jgi:hypothetical protein
MFLVWMKDNGVLTAQKWSLNPTSLSDPYFRSRVYLVVSLPDEDANLTVTQLVDKYGEPK